jgi:cell fate regulator YaaT (PSP1 superfamily)
MAPNSKTQDTNPYPQIAGVRFQPTGKTYHFDATGYPDLQPGDFVLVETSRGKQLGEVVGTRPLHEDEKREELKPIKRRATGHDLAKLDHWREEEANILAAAREAAAQLNLPIKVVTAEYTFDGQRLTLLYVSEDKDLECGKLLRRLQKMTDSRVDIRRVGVRDQAKLMGGYGACGEPRCCARFLSEFDPVSIKMAKIQGVSLNPAEITGMCGRLRCCLVYEDEQYRTACKMMPRRKKRVRTPYGEGKIVDLLPLKGHVVVQIEDRRVEIPAEEVEPI